jgi:hypothetical protein
VVAALAAASVAFLHGGSLVVVDTATRAQHVVLRNAGAGPVGWSGDGRLVSSGGKIAGGPELPTARLTWSPSGERAAYETKTGALFVWTPRSGSTLVVPAAWGAQSVAWSRDGRLAVGRALCPRHRCGLPTRSELWVWNGRSLQRRLALPRGAGAPQPTGWTHDGHVLWWLYPNSSSIAADGVRWYADRRLLGMSLAYDDYVVRCGAHLARAAGGDRFSTHGKSIVFDGHDVTRDRSRSWVSPACNAHGKLVAAAARNSEPSRMGREHRALWQLLPHKGRLTDPPPGFTDEFPQVLPDGSVLFVRTRQTSFRRADQWYATEHGTLELLGNGMLLPLGDVTYTTNEITGDFGNYYGHYAWSSRIAVKPSR